MDLKYEFAKPIKTKLAMSNNPNMLNEFLRDLVKNNFFIRGYG